MNKEEKKRGIPFEFIYKRIGFIIAVAVVSTGNKIGI